MKTSNDTLIKHLPNPNNIQTIIVGGETASVWFITDFMAGPCASMCGGDENRDDKETWTNEKNTS